MTKKNDTLLNPFIWEDKAGYFVIIVAGGSGMRMKSAVPKQFLELQGKPILMHTIEKFTHAIPTIQVIVVLPSAHTNAWTTLCEQYQFSTPHQIVKGGETRFHSVKNGLEKVPDNAIVGIHDAVRPLVNEITILNTFQTAKEKSNACPAMPLNESIREVENDNNKAVGRNKYFIIQTPQCFHSQLIRRAFLQPYNPAFTDDATVAEMMGEKINLVEGNPENIKITTPQDLLIAEFLAAQK